MLDFEKSAVGELPAGLIGYDVHVRRAASECVVYSATFSDGRIVFVSGKPGPRFAAIGQITFGDNDSVFYAGILDEEHHLVRNGEILGKYAWIGKLSRSPDGAGLAFPIMESASENQYQMVVNGAAGKSFNGIGEAVWHPQKLLIAYVTAIGESERVILGEDELPTFEEVRGLQFSPAGDFFYWARKAGNWWLCDVNGVVHCSEGIDPPPFGKLLFAIDGQMSFWFCKRGKWYVSSESGDYGPWHGFQWAISGPYRSEGGLTYVTEHRGKARVCRNEVAGQAFDAVGMPVTLQNVLAYKARAGSEEFLMLNGKRGKGFQVLWPEEREFATYLEDAPVISPTGDRLAFVAGKEDGEEVVLNDAEQHTFNNINGQIAFGPHSECLVYGGQNGRENFVIVDSEQFGPFDKVFSAERPTGLRLLQWCPEFVGDGKLLRFFCVEGRAILKCTVSL